MNSDNFKQNFINAVLGKLNGNTKYAPDIEQYLNTFSDAQQRQDVANGLNGGNKEILAKQIELGINRPDVNNQEQLDLARTGKFNLPTKGGVRQGGLINGYNQGYNLNYDNPTDQISTRIGQALGTVKRGLDSPFGRAVIAYGAARMMGDANPLKQAATAYGMRENANTANQFYRNQLNNMGVDTSNISGEITGDMFKNYLAGYNAQNKNVTYNDLALYDDNIKQAILKGEINGNQAIPVNYAKPILTNQRGLTDARIQKYQKDLEYLDSKIANGTATIAERHRANDIRAALVQSQIELNKVKKDKISNDANNGNGSTTTNSNGWTTENGKKVFRFN